MLPTASTSLIYSESVSTNRFHCVGVGEPVFRYRLIASQNVVEMRHELPYFLYTGAYDCQCVKGLTAKRHTREPHPHISDLPFSLQLSSPKSTSLKQLGGSKWKPLRWAIARSRGPAEVKASLPLYLAILQNLDESDQRRRALVLLDKLSIMPIFWSVIWT